MVDRKRQIRFTERSSRPQRHGQFATRFGAQLGMHRVSKVHLEDQNAVVDHHVLEAVLLLQVQPHATASLHVVHELWLLPWGQLPDQFP